MTTVGIENHNPMNIKPGRDRWQGLKGVDKRGHGIFESDRWSYRAGVRTLAQKSANGKRTIRAIVQDWAPVNDTVGSIPGAPKNDPGKYARTVASWMGCGVDQPLEIFDGARIVNKPRLMMLIDSIVRYENGAACRPDMAEIAAGIELYRETWDRG